MNACPDPENEKGRCTDNSAEANFIFGLRGSDDDKAPQNYGPRNSDSASFQQMHNTWWPVRVIYIYICPSAPAPLGAAF